MRTSPSGNGPTVSTDDRISTLTNDPILVNSESELGGTNSNILEFDKSFTDLLSERPLEDNLERIPDISYKLARNGNLPMKNNRLYLKMLELNLGKSSIIFDSEPSRLSNLQWYHGEILLRLIFDTTVSEDVIDSVLARPNFMGLVLDNTDFIPLDFLKRLASSEPLTKACRLDDVIIKFVLNQFQGCISTDCYLGDSFVLSQMIQNKGRSSFKIWQRILFHKYSILPYHFHHENDDLNHWYLIIIHKNNQFLEFNLFNSLFSKSYSDTFHTDLINSFELFLKSNMSTNYEHMSIRIFNKSSSLQLDCHACGHILLYNAICLIRGHVPVDLNKTFHQFRLNLCYILLQGSHVLSS